MNNIRILLVENDRDVIDDLTDEFEALDYVVYSFKKGEIALRECERLQPTIIIMDIDLDGEIDGIETAERIQTIEGMKNIPILFHTQFEDRFEEAMKTNPSHWLEKNQDMGQILKNVKIALGRSKVNYFDSQEKKLLHIETSNGTFHFIQKDDVVAIEISETDNSMCKIHLYSKGSMVHKTMDISIKRLIEKLNIPTLLKISSGVALNFRYPYYEAIKSKDSALYAIMDKEHLDIKPIKNPHLEIKRSYREQVTKLITKL